MIGCSVLCQPAKMNGCFQNYPSVCGARLPILFSIVIMCMWCETRL